MEELHSKDKPEITGDKLKQNFLSLCTSLVADLTKFSICESFLRLFVPSVRNCQVLRIVLMRGLLSKLHIKWLYSVDCQLSEANVLGLCYCIFKSFAYCTVLLIWDHITKLRFSIFSGLTPHYKAIFQYKLFSRKLAKEALFNGLYKAFNLF